MVCKLYCGQLQSAANFKRDLRGSPYKSIAANYASIDFLLHIITNSIGINSRSKVRAHLAAIGYNGVVVNKKRVKH